jgi:hypothetical protein
MMAMMLLGQLGHDALQIPSHAGDSAIESCWRQCYRGDLATMRWRYRVMLAIVLSSRAGNDTVGVTWPRRDEDAESCW